MKKVISASLMCFFVILLLFTCSQRKNTEVLEFPNTPWGISADEVFDLYGITKADTTLYDEMSRSIVFTIDGFEAFGEKTSKILFNFGDFAGNGEKGLCRVRVSYPEGTDMNKILKKLENMYGENVSDVVVYSKLSVFGNDKLSENRYQESEEVKLWADRFLADMIPEDEAEYYERGWEIFQDELTRENWDEFSQNARMVTVIWSIEEDRNTLDFDAYNLGVYTALKSQQEEQP